MTQRIIQLSYIRVLAMVMIVAFHCLCLNAGIWGNFPCLYVRSFRIFANFLNTIDLPMFFFVSGFLYSFLFRKGKYKSLGKFYLRKCQRLLFPYLLWGSIMILIMPDVYRITDLGIGIGHLWFLLALFIIFSFFGFLRNALFKTNLISDMFIFLVLIISYDLIAKYSTLPMAVNAAWRYSPIFYYGIMFERHGLLSNLNNKMLPSLFVAMLLLVELLCVIDIPYINRLLVIPAICFTISVLFHCLRNISSINNERIRKMILNMDKNCMGIYILHHILIWLLFVYTPYVRYMNDNVILCTAILFVSVFAVSWSFSNLINKYAISRFIFG